MLIVKNILCLPFINFLKSKVDLQGVEARLKGITDECYSHVPSIGEYVLVFESPYLRRGCVTRIAENFVEAFFIDYGVTKV
jgi:hypothetical protein